MRQKEKGYILAEIVLVVGVLACLLSIVTKSYIWFDEGFSINLINNSFTDIILFTALDVHPPLYYLILKIFAMILGHNVVAYYAPSILSYIILLIITFLFFKKYFSEEAALMVSVALSATPNMFDFALQIRMYSLGMLLVTASFYIVYILTKNVLEDNQYSWSKYWLFLAVINVLAAYTHYFAGVAAVSISFFLLFYLGVKGKNKKKVIFNWCIYCALMVILYLPWLSVLIRQMSSVGSGYWIGKLTETELHAFPGILFSMSNDLYGDLLSAAYIIGLFLFLLHFRKNHQNYWLSGCYIVILLWFAFGIGYSVLKTPILVSRYMVVLLPLFWIPICVCYTKEEVKKYSAAFFVLLAVCFINNYEKLYDTYLAYNQESMVSDITSLLSEDDVLFYTNIKEMCIHKAYFPEATCYALKGIDADEVFHYWPEMTGCTMIEDMSEMDVVKGDIWMFNTDCMAQFQECGWQVEEVEVVTGIVYRVYR